jgi:altronate dehydratase large subunit
MTVWGFRRGDGRFGVRNHVLLLPTVICAAETARRAAQGIPGVVCLPNQQGCAQVGADAEMTRLTLLGTGLNANVYGVVVVGLGCETTQPQQMAQEIAASGKPVELVVIQEEGGTVRAAARAAELAERLAREAAAQEREPCDLAGLVVALECGGSDPTSGLAANPAVGLASDRVVAEGGTVILSETTEMIGAEHLLAARARDPGVAAGILHLVAKMEAAIRGMGGDVRRANPTPGNMAGGLTTLEEKSLGCLHKAGSSPPVEVLPYAARPTRRGLVIMDSPGADVESVTGMVAGGAQICLFTTGRGTPVGNPVAPVIKITGNPQTFRRMADNIDINAGEVLEGSASLRDVGERIFQELIAVAEGKPTRAEALGHGEFTIWRAGISV